MSSDENNPEVVSWRLSAMEAKVDTLTEKVDALRELVQRNQCPHPGACVAALEGIKRLETIVEKHEVALQAVRTDIATAKAGARALSAGAVALGSVIGAIASLVLQFVSK